MTDIASALPDEAEIAVVFGSVARGEEKATSDIDVLVLGDELSELRVNARLRPVGRKHSREIHALVFSRNEFSTRHQGGWSRTIRTCSRTNLIHAASSKRRFLSALK